MFRDFKMRLNDFLSGQEYFRTRLLKKQFSSIALVGEDEDSVETVFRCPTWFSSLVTGANEYFFTGGGMSGLNELAHPLPNSILGNLVIGQYKVGKAEHTGLTPSFIPLAISEVKKLNRSVVVSYKGIGGAPDLIRTWSTGALRYTERSLNPHGKAFDTEYKLYSKVAISVDDTDSSTKGATFNTALQLASVLERSSQDYNFLRLTLSFNWPANPAKTTNNASSALVFAVTPGKEDQLARDFERLIRKHTVSKETGMAVMKKVRAPEGLKAYARKVKRERVTVEEAFKAAEEAHIKAIPVTGERGLIGALSVLGLVDAPAEAITPVIKTEPAPFTEVAAQEVLPNLQTAIPAA